MWKVVFTKQAEKDAKKLDEAGLRPKAEKLLDALQKGPRQARPRFERLVGDLAGASSRRVNMQHRLVCQVLEESKTVKVIRMWTHYE
jgi:Txe/YoeB family toxin of toxin-antitoxin system